MVSDAETGLLETLPQFIISRHTQCCTDTCEVWVYGGTSSNIIVRKVKDNRCNVR